MWTADSQTALLVQLPLLAINAHACACPPKLGEVTVIIYWLHARL